MKAQNAKVGDLLQWALEDVSVVGVSFEEDVILTVRSTTDGNVSSHSYRPDEECSPGRVETE